MSTQLPTNMSANTIKGDIDKLHLEIGYERERNRQAALGNCHAFPRVVRFTGFADYNDAADSVRSGGPVPEVWSESIGPW